MSCYRGRVAVACLAWMFACGGAARGEIPPKVVESGIKATAMVEVSLGDARRTGSAFCVSKSGLFVTNHHVVAGQAARIHLVLESGRPRQRRVEARLVRDDALHDLALLKVEADDGLEVLPLGRDDTLRHTANIAAFGFPFGRLKDADVNVAPDITVMTGRITSLPRENGRIRYVQFDNQLNPGNSGGPVLDESGKVIGVAVMSLQGSALNRAVPVDLLTAFLEPPVVLFDPPSPTFVDRWKSTTWTIELLPTLTPTLPAGLSVALLVGPMNSEPKRTEAVRVKQGSYKATFIPAPRDPKRVLRMTIHPASGPDRTVEVLDLPITVGGREILLGDLSQLDLRARRAQVAVGSSSFSGPIQGLDQARTDKDQQPLPELANATSIDVVEATSSLPMASLNATVELKLGGKSLSSTTMVVAVDRGEPKALASEPPPSAPPTVSAAPASRAYRAPGGGTVVVTRLPNTGLPDDDSLVRVGGPLRSNGVPLNAAADLKPPTKPIAEALVLKETPSKPKPVSVIVRGFPSGVLPILSGGSHLYSLAFSPDGKTLAIGGDDDVIRLIDPINAEEVGRLKQDSWVQGISFSADGKTIVAGSWSKRLVSWDLATRKLSYPVNDEGYKTNMVFGSPSGRRAFALYDEGAAGESTKARLWDLATGKALQALSVPRDRTLIVPSADGVWFLVVANWTAKPKPATNPPKPSLQLVEAETGKVAWTLEDNYLQILGASFMPGGKELAVVRSNGSISYCSIKDGKSLRELRFNFKVHGEVTDLVFSPDGRSMATKATRSIHVWDLAQGRSVAHVDFQNDPGKLCFSPDGSKLAFGTFRKLGGIWTLPNAGVVAARSGDGPTEPAVLNFGGKIRDVVAGGGGRYLVVLLANPSRVAVFDARSGDIEKTLPLPSDNALIAAGARRFLVAFPDDGIIQQYDLARFARVPGPSESPINGKIHLLTMGADSDGPLLVGWRPSTETATFKRPMRFSLVDPGPLTVMKVDGLSTSGQNRFAAVTPAGGSFTLGPILGAHGEVHARASGDGSLLAFWDGQWGRGFYTATVRNRGLKFFEDLLFSNGYLAPGPVGSVVYGASGGRRDPNGVPIGEEVPYGGPPLGMPTGGMLVPTSDSNLYLDLGFPLKMRNGSDGDHAYPSATVRHAVDGRLLLVVTNLKEMDELNINSAHDELTAEKRFWYIPAANLFLTLPPQDDRLVIRKLDLEKSLKSLGQPYLIGTSPTRVAIAAGKTLAYQASARSDSGGHQWTLESGPEGMIVKSNGLVLWPWPKPSAEGQPVPVLLRVVDASGKSAFQKLEIVVR